MKAFLLVSSVLWLALSGTAQGQTLLDPGFESYSVAAGGFVKPTTGPWIFANDAGVVEPFSPPSSTGSLNTWSATFAAIEGAQYASTYGSFDTLEQSVTFAMPGDYLISLYAAAPSGTVTVPPLPPITLGDGAFRFTLDGVSIGGAYTVQTDVGWTLYTQAFTIAAPGSHTVGVRNSLTAAYFINYDGFAIVPEPATGLLVLLSLGLGLARRSSARRT